MNRKIIIIWILRIIIITISYSYTLKVTSESPLDQDSKLYKTPKRIIIKNDDINLFFIIHKFLIKHIFI